MAVDKETKNKTEKKRKKRKYGAIVHFIFLAVTAIAALVLCSLITVKYMGLREKNEALSSEVVRLSDELETTYTEEEKDALIKDASERAATEAEQKTRSDILDGVKDRLLAGGSWLDAVKALYPDELVVLDQGYCFIPISNTLVHHPYASNQFLVDEDGYMQYQQDGEIISKKGIDVSVYQGKIDWDKVAMDGIEYAFIRAGVRGYTKGDIISDDNFNRNIAGAVSAGIDAGVYFVTQAINEEEAVREAQYVLDQIEPYEVSYPIVIDVEDIENAEPRSASLTVGERTKCVIAFCETIREAGYTPMIYGNMKSFLRRLDLDQLEPYRKWIAYYDDELYYPYAFDVWQYTDKGSVSGIEGNVDYNISFYKAQ